MDDGKSVSIKGSGLKGTMKEKALQQFMKDIIDSLLKGKKDTLYDLYHDYIFNASTVSSKDICNWTSKKTITKSILNPQRTTEQRILDAIQHKKIQEGDKIRVFFDTDTTVCLEENFTGIYDKARLHGKVYKTLSIFETIIDIDIFPDYTLKRNKGRLDEMLVRKQIINGDLLAS